MKVRKAQEKDVKEFPLLFSTVYPDYSMYRVESFALYKQFLTGDTDEYLFVVEEKDTLLGYVTMGVRTIGSAAMISVYEIVAVSKKGYDLLWEKVEEIGMEKDVAAIDTVAPDKSGLAAYLTNAGFLKTKAIATVVQLLDVKKILQLFVENAVSERFFKKDVCVLFCVGKEKVQVKLPEGVVDTGDRADVTVVLSANHLFSLLLKRSPWLSLVLKRRVQITPVHKMMTVCAVIDYLAVDMQMVTLFTELI